MAGRFIGIGDVEIRPIPRASAHVEGVGRTFDQTETGSLEFGIAGERSLPRVVVNLRESISPEILRRSLRPLAGFERKKATGSRVVGTCQKWHCSPHRGMGHCNADWNEVDGKFGHATTP